MSRRDASDWFTYEAERTRPRASHERPMPAAAKVKAMGLNDRVTEVERLSASMLVEESDASDSMILKIVRKFRGE